MAGHMTSPLALSKPAADGWAHDIATDGRAHDITTCVAQARVPTVLRSRSFPLLPFRGTVQLPFCLQNRQSASFCARTRPF